MNIQRYYYHCAALGLAIVLMGNAARAAPMPGDFNGDWRVDAADYVLLRKAGGSYGEWRNNFGKTVADVAVHIGPTTDIQSAIDNNPEGTLFYVRAGERRLTSPIEPKTGDTFVAEPGAVLNGSRLLSNFQQSSGRWYVTGQTQEGGVHGDCLPGYRCDHPEDLFIDNVPLQHVTSLDQVAPGKWYFDYLADSIYIGDNPAGHKVETSVTNWAIIPGSASDVGIYGFTVEKFAVPGQDAAIETGNGWTVANNKVQFNHAAGIRAKGGSIIRNNNIHTNGQTGVTAEGSNVVFDGNEIAFNNFARFNPEWEAGGSKFAYTTGLTVKNNYVHHNYGPGLWTDIDNVDTLYEGNVVVDNYLSGIQHEISYNAKIKNNTVQRNGNTVAGETLWGAQIFVYASSNVEVSGNDVLVNSAAADGIVVVQQDRGFGALGTYYSHDNHVHHNTITLTPGASGNGMGESGVADWGDWPENANNLFDHNNYIVPNSARHWVSQSRQTWQQFQSSGYELHGTRTINAAASSTAVPEPGANWMVLFAALLVVLVLASRIGARLKMVPN